MTQAPRHPLARLIQMDDVPGREEPHEWRGRPSSQWE